MHTTTRLKVIDSHTGGEPTRLLVEGGPDLGGRSMAECRTILAREHDWIRSALVHEPRGWDVIVGAVLCEPVDPACAAGVVFFNNVGYLNMCGHGTIGLVATLAHLGRIAPGPHRIETPVGVVTATLHADRRVSFENVPSYRYRQGVPLELDGGRRVSGDVAWGGNWFFISADHGRRIELAGAAELTDYCWSIRRALEKGGITGADGGLIDHIELFAPSPGPEADARNFVLCPGGAYDRSPCGTGTSAKLACLAADGRLAEGQTWRQQSIVGSIFEATYRRAGERIVPTVTGTAFVSAETTVIVDPDDPFAHGIGSPG